MSPCRLLLAEAWLEFRLGIRSGIFTLTFLGMVAYLLMVLVNGEDIQQMGASDVPRNSSVLIYLMATGCMFFLFFALAWVFSQPLLRDRKASLHEIVLATPNSLKTLLWGRFLGAAMVGAVLSASSLFGYLLSPTLEWMHAIPPHSIMATPWHVLGHAFFCVMMPTSVGIGALYFLITVRTRHVGGAFAIASALMLLWMFAIIVLRGGFINPTLAAAVDPSLFTDAHAYAEIWTPFEKTYATLPADAGYWLNRLVWVLLPLLLLAVALHFVKRESFVLERPRRKPKREARSKTFATVHSTGSTASIRRPSWFHVFTQETSWQIHFVLQQRAFYILSVLLVVVTACSGVVHVVWHAEGPMVPRPDLILPLFQSNIYLVIAFIVAAFAGAISRRDDVVGISEILDATPAPHALRLYARAAAVTAITFCLSLAPALAGILVTSITAPHLNDMVLVFWYQACVMAPPLIEIALSALLMHALIRRAGLAYAASMFVTFILIVNHEMGLVTYPPLTFGIPAQTALSGLTRIAPWSGFVAILGIYKLAFCVILVGIAAVVLPRGVDSRLSRGMRSLRVSATGNAGLLIVIGVVVMGLSGGLLYHRLIKEGGYEPKEAQRKESAQWERRWFASAGTYAVSGGEMQLRAEPSQGRVSGLWRLHQVRAANGSLDAELPSGFELVSIQVNGASAQSESAFDHLRVKLGACAAQGCEVEIHWTTEPPLWTGEGRPSWIVSSGVWMKATDIAPRLGVDPDRLLRAPQWRSQYGLDETISWPSSAAMVATDAVAPAGTWSWQVSAGDTKNATSSDGATNGQLSFGVAWSPYEVSTQFSGLNVLSDRRRTDTAEQVAEDIAQMTACVNRRLGSDVRVDRGVQWPRGLAVTEFGGGTLQLAEDPDWDVAAKGVGRELRRVEIATALARRFLLDASDLRDAHSTPWLRDGLSGALGLLCIGDADGLQALDQVLVRYADRTTRGLAANSGPLSTLALATEGGWAEWYGPLSQMLWLSHTQPEEIRSLLNDLRSGRNITDVVEAHVGKEDGLAQLGLPQSTTIDVKRKDGRTQVRAGRWQWLNGGWQPAGDEPTLTSLRRRDGIIVVGPALGRGHEIEITDNEEQLIVDARPGFERSAELLLSGKPLRSGQ